MPQLKNKFLRKTGWFIYGLCGFLTFGFLLGLSCPLPRFYYFSSSIAFFFLHWLALKISQNFGLRDKKIKLFKDPLLYCLYLLFLAYTLIYPTSRSCSWDIGSEKFIPFSASSTVATTAKECAVKKISGDDNPTFIVPKSNKYTFLPASGNCNGDANGLLSAVSENSSKYPTYSYNVETGVKSCSHDGPNEELHGCSARRDGKW